ncbi:MAG TPA: ABC transporter ATP-binding protein [Xanthobacteraceae bacterium]|jgi:ABC-2 type transport system ATP-binding protein|nr:ABC transporter ATP-binding protein [Xanthobacteraceae bacterium]
MHGTDTIRPATGEISDAIVRVDGLSKRYGRTVALDGVSLEIRTNELFALLGPNGAGKTTLIHILCTILAPDSGTAALKGCDVVRQPRMARRHLGVVFQEPSVDDRLTVFENLNFHGLIYQVPAATRRQRIDELLALVELEDWRHALVRSLSSGMKRRVEIARALIHDSAVLILDEPTTGLDAQSRERIWAYLMRLRKERALTIIVTTHYIEEVEGCDRICVIDRGRILAVDTPAALKAAHGRELIRVVPDDAATADAIRAAYPAARTPGTGAAGGDGAIVIEADGDAAAEVFLKKFGGRVRRLSIDSPSLESVFLSLTGRELRDQPAGKRERTYAFGRRGGEHTK